NSLQCLVGCHSFKIGNVLRNQLTEHVCKLVVPVDPWLADNGRNDVAKIELLVAQALLRELVGWLQHSLSNPEHQAFRSPARFLLDLSHEHSASTRRRSPRRKTPAGITPPR